MALLDSDLIRIIDAQIGFESLSSLELFNLRVLLHDNDPIVDLEKDLEELAYYPERLLTSHKDEWILFCRKSLFKTLKQENFERDSAVRHLQELKHTIGAYAEAETKHLDRIRETIALLHSDNVALFESPASRRIRKLIG